jgi:ribulose 1,5-bisphosphate synthetase/thiazole synthase
MGGSPDAARGCGFLLSPHPIQGVTAMNTQYIETLIIGAGQAGLAIGYHLRRRGRPMLIVDANARIGDNWRQQ